MRRWFRRKSIIEKPVYIVVSGAGGTYTKGSGKTLTSTCKRSAEDETTFRFSHFTGIKVDGKAVPENDASGKTNWKAESGSVIIELQLTYLDTLSSGEHKIAVQFDDGADAGVSFTVKAKPPTPTPTPTPTPKPKKPASTVPNTGDESNALLWIWLMAVSFAGVMMISRRRFFLK